MRNPKEGNPQQREQDLSEEKEEGNKFKKRKLWEHPFLVPKGDTRMEIKERQKNKK